MYYPTFEGQRNDMRILRAARKIYRNLYRKFKFFGNFKFIQYLVTAVGPHFQWMESDIKIHGMAGKQYVFLHRRQERPLSSESLAGISTLTQKTPCNCAAYFDLA